jgi:hypothetical protein
MLALISGKSVLVMVNPSKNGELLTTDTFYLQGVQRIHWIKEVILPAIVRSGTCNSLFSEIQESLSLLQR